MSDTTAIEVGGLTKTYGPRTAVPVYAVRDLTFSIGAGELVGLLGPNGAGKTTTVKCIASLVTPTCGRVLIRGWDTATHRRETLQQIAVVLEGNRNTYWRLSPRENLQFFIGLHGLSVRKGRGVIDSLLSEFDLMSKRNTPVRELSRGMQQKVAVACALAKGVDILLLDEPALGLDVQTTNGMKTMLKRMTEEKGYTILVSSHDMHMIQDICHRVLIMNEGELVLDDMTESLISLFKAQAYRIEVKGQLPPVLAERLKGSYKGRIRVEQEHAGGTTILDVDLRSADEIYEIIALMGRFNLPLVGVGKQFPDLKEIFLKTIGAPPPSKGEHV